MADRQQQLNQLQSFIGKIDTEVTMILQHLQWDSKHLLEGKHMVGCKFDGNHRVPDSSKETHEQQCLLNANGYSTEDVLLPDPFDTNSSTLIKLNQADIRQIINKAAASDSSFRRGVSSTQVSEHAALEPLSLERLQERYSADERRALHDAVVAAAPSCHDLSDLALLGDAGESSTSRQQKSRAQILAELRDMKRRRTKYRVAAKTRNYSDVLRDVIKTQMEVYTEVKVEESSKVEDPPRRHEGFKAEQRLSSKFPISSSYRSSNNDESRNIHSKHGPKERSQDVIDFSSNKRRWNEFDQNTDCSDRTYREENYYDDDRKYGSKRSRTKYNEESSSSEKNNYKGRKHGEGKYYDDNRQSASKTTRTKYSEESSTSDRKDYKDRKYKEGKYYEDDKRSDGKRKQIKEFEENPASERSYHKEKKYREKHEKDRSYTKSRHGDVETERDSGRTKYKEDREEQRRYKKRFDEESYRSDRKHEKSSHCKRENRE